MLNIYLIGYYLDVKRNGICPMSWLELEIMLSREVRHKRTNRISLVSVIFKGRK